MNKLFKSQVYKLIMSKETISKAIELIENNYNSIIHPIIKLNYLTYSNKYNNELKKEILNLKKYFDEDYILFLDENNLFLEKLNKRFILFSNDLINKLNEIDLIDEMDIINSFKTRIELGYDRYFIQKNKIVVEFNKNNFEYILKDKNEITIYFEDWLLNLIEKKENRKKISVKEIKPILNYFPELIYSNENKHEFEIFKSLFPQQKVNLTQINKGKYNLENLNDINVAILVYWLLK